MKVSEVGVPDPSNLAAQILSRPLLAVRASAIWAPVGAPSGLCWSQTSVPVPVGDEAELVDEVVLLNDEELGDDVVVPDEELWIEEAAPDEITVVAPFGPNIGMLPTSSGSSSSNPSSPTSTSSDPSISNERVQTDGAAEDEEEVEENELELVVEAEECVEESDVAVLLCCEVEVSVASPSGPITTGGKPGGGGIIPPPGTSGTTIIARGANHMGRMVVSWLLSVVVVTENDPDFPLIVDIVS